MKCDMSLTFPCVSVPAVVYLSKLLVFLNLRSTVWGESKCEFYTVYKGFFQLRINFKENISLFDLK